MKLTTKFAHTNIIAKDWQKLATFYEDVFECIRVLPERNLSGQWLDEATGIPAAEIHGIHLRLPGYGDSGPTLEIFHYTDQEASLPTVVNRPGFAHIAFAVNDVAAARDAVLQAGGGTVGKLTTVDIAGAGTITFMYVTDPEGNILELQQWEA